MEIWIHTDNVLNILGFFEIDQVNWIYKKCVLCIKHIKVGALGRETTPRLYVVD